MRILFIAGKQIWRFRHGKQHGQPIAAIEGRIEVCFCRWYT